MSWWTPSPPYQADQDTAATQWLIFQSQRTAGNHPLPYHHHQHSTIPWGTGQPPGGRLIPLHLFHHRRVTNSGYGFAFPASPSLDSWDALATIHDGILHSSVSNQGIYSTAKEVQHGINWFQHIFHYPEATGLIKKWNGLLKTQLWHKLKDNTLKYGPLSVFQDTVYALNQRLFCVTVSPRSRILESWNQEIQVEMSYFPVSPNNSLKECLLSILTALRSAALETSVPKKVMITPDSTKFLLN